MLVSTSAVSYGKSLIVIALLVFVGFVAWTPSKKIQFPAGSGQTAHLVVRRVDEPSHFSQTLGNAAIHYVTQYLQQKLEDETLATDLNPEQLIARFLNEATAMAVRKIDAWRLAKLASPEAKAALLQVLQFGPEVLRAAVAEALGHGPWADASNILKELLASEQNPVVLKGAISGLAFIGTDDAISPLTALLLNEQTDAAIRKFIALKLGDVQTGAAFEALLNATYLGLPEDILQSVTAGLAKYPFEQTGDIYRKLLADQQLSALFKAEATEALAGADKKALPFLLETAAHFPDAEVRASAAWAAGFNPESGHLGKQLSKLVQVEPDEEVRRRLYEALMRQDAIPSQELLAQALAENDPATRVAAANMLAISLQQPGSDGISQQRFNQEAVPDLVATALGDYNTNLRFRAVFALARAGTADAKAALASISRQGGPQIAELANSALSQTNKP
ncbi:MAG: HEAT repeat domain-containing protein [Methylococcales bacterium]|nr:HEAT repeat domain-containing protein [Methylococcales bacterium]